MKTRIFLAITVLVIAAVMSADCSRSRTSSAINTTPSQTTTGAKSAAVSLAQPIIFGGRIEYRGHTIHQSPEGKTILSLNLYCTHEMKMDYTLWLHLVSMEGRKIGFDQLLNPPTTTWRVGDAHTHDVQLDAPPGQYSVEFGLWVWPKDYMRLRRNDNGEEAAIIDRILVR